MKVESNSIGKIILAAILMAGFSGAVLHAENAAAPVAPANQAAKTSNLPFGRMMGILSQNMTLWSSLSEDNKKKAVEAAVTLYRNRENTAILRTADFYVTQIDQGLKSNASLQGMDIMSLLKLLAVMEYDFYNGQNKDALAKQVLGDKMYESVRMRRQGLQQ